MHLGACASSSFHEIPLSILTGVRVAVALLAILHSFFARLRTLDSANWACLARPRRDGDSRYRAVDFRIESSPDSVCWRARWGGSVGMLKACCDSRNWLHPPETSRWLPLGLVTRWPAADMFFKRWKKPWRWRVPTHYQLSVSYQISVAQDQ